MRRRRIAWSAGAVAAVAAALGLWRALPAAFPAGPRPRPVVFHPGGRDAHLLRLDSTLRLGGTGAAPRTVRQLLAGTLHLRVLEPGPDGARVALQLDGAQLTLDGQGSAALDGQLARPFVATFAPDGTLRGLDFAPAAGEQARTALGEALRTFQVVVPDDAGARWEVEEAHATGRFRAGYRLTADGRILKAKLGYLPAAAGAPRVSVRRAEATARVDPAASWLERMVVEEELAASLGSGLFTASSLQAELRREPLAVAARGPLALDALPAEVGGLGAALAALGPAAPPAEARPGAAAPRDLDALVAALGAARELSAALLYELRDLIVREPGAAARLLAALRRGLDDRTAAALINALGMAATEEAQAALRAVLEEPALGRMNRTRAALALGGASEIDDTSLAALRALAERPRAEGLADTAVLSLGMAGDTLRAGGSRRYAALRDDLVERVGAAADGGGAAAALLALGNTHDPALAEVAAARLEDPSPAARSAAAHALGKLGGGADPGLLARRLADEPDGTVRAALAGSLAALPRPTAAALALVDEAVRREEEPLARFELARLLGENLDTFPEGRATLAALAAGDPSRRIREYAAHAAWGR